MPHKHRDKEKTHHRDHSESKDQQDARKKSKDSSKPSSAKKATFEKGEESEPKSVSPPGNDDALPFSKNLPGLTQGKRLTSASATLEVLAENESKPFASYVPPKRKHIGKFISAIDEKNLRKPKHHQKLAYEGTLIPFNDDNHRKHKHRPDSHKAKHFGESHKSGTYLSDNHRRLQENSHKESQEWGKREDNKLRNSQHSHNRRRYSKDSKRDGFRREENDFENFPSSHRRHRRSRREESDRSLFLPFPEEYSDRDFRYSGRFEGDDNEYNRMPSERNFYQEGYNDEYRNDHDSLPKGEYEPYPHKKYEEDMESRTDNTKVHSDDNNSIADAHGKSSVSNKPLPQTQPRSETYNSFQVYDEENNIRLPNLPGVRRSRSRSRQTSREDFEVENFGGEEEETPTRRNPTTVFSYMEERNGNDINLSQQANVDINSNIRHAPSQTNQFQDERPQPGPSRRFQREEQRRDEDENRFRNRPEYLSVRGESNGKVLQDKDRQRPPPPRLISECKTYT